MCNKQEKNNRCNGPFGLRVRSTPYLLFALVRDDVIVYLHKFKFF